MTPLRFFKIYFPNWSMGTITDKIGFDFDVYKENFPDKLLHHALQRSKYRDQYGFVSHYGKWI